MTDTKPEQGDVRPALLGLFVAGQLLFLLVANAVYAVQQFLPPLPDPPDPSLGRTVLQATRQLTDFGAAMTLQTQTWSMFPAFPTRSTFPTVRLVWQPTERGAAPMVVTLRSEFEPDDPYHHCSLDLLSDRRYNWDAWQGQVFSARDKWAALPDETSRQQHYQGLGRGWWRPMHAHMSWWLAQYRRDHPDAPLADEVILLHRVYETPSPGTEPWRWRGPTESVLARWRPNAAVPQDEAPVELYDPVAGRFLAIKTKPTKP